ncbi:MAG: carotenoid biosynthesis protein [Terracidiphilus sp.]
MTTNSGIAKWQTVILWTLLLVYAQSRICQQYPDKISIQWIVFMQVVPLAAFALVHGSILYGARGMAAFTAFCLGVGALSESLSLRTGFPFGHYFFTDLMGPKLIQLPILLVLAYLGIGYCSWILSLLILGYRNRPLAGSRVIAAPMLASFIMLLWDLSMEAIWATLDHAWIWREGGSFFGVPITNFLGWFFTAFLFYLSFALYCRANPIRQTQSFPSYWRFPILCYGICAYGNLFIFRTGLFPHAVTDAAGKTWMTADILLACSLVSILAMGPIALLAWHRLNLQEA